MTGGAGFSKQASQSFKDNRSLGQIRPEKSDAISTRTGKNANGEELEESIQHRMGRKTLERKWKSKVLAAWLLLGLIFILILFLS